LEFVASKRSLQAGGLAAISRWSSAANTTGRPMQRTCIPAGCQTRLEFTLQQGIQDKNTLKRELQRWAAIGYATLPVCGLASRRDAGFSRFGPPVASLRSATG